MPDSTPLFKQIKIHHKRSVYLRNKAKIKSGENRTILSMNAQNSNQRFFHQKKMTDLSSALLAILLCLYIGILLPSHYHSDGKSHDECNLCIVQEQSVKVETIFILPLLPSTISTISPSTTPLRFSSIVYYYQTRAPPPSLRLI